MLNKWVPGFIFLVIGLFFLGLVNLNEMLCRVGQKLSVVVFLQPQYPQENVSSLTEQIKHLSNVANVFYVSPEKALAGFTQDEDIVRQVQLVGENPLPGSFVIKLKDSRLQYVKPLINRLSEMPAIDEVKYGEQEALKIQNIITQIGWIKNFIVAIMIIFCLLLFYYVYSFDLMQAGHLVKSKLYGQGLLIYTINLIVVGLLIRAGFVFILKPLGRFVFFSPRQLIYFVLTTLVLQFFSLQVCLLRSQVKVKLK